MRVICFRDRVVALAGDRVVLAPSLAVLEEDHPERRFVAALCLYYGVICRHWDGERYLQDRAEAFARDLLMPAEAFAPVVAWPDHELAELFIAPLDQVAPRRCELSGAPDV